MKMLEWLKSSLSCHNLKMFDTFLGLMFFILNLQESVLSLTKKNFLAFRYEACLPRHPSENRVGNGKCCKNSPVDIA